MSTIYKPIITRIDTTANWTTLNPVPANGEQCIEVLGGGLFKLKIGDGVSPWISLDYYQNREFSELAAVAFSGKYEDLKNRPAIDGVILTPETTKEDLGITDLNNIQVREMPEITEDMYGRIVQYVGETTEEYTNGYFYKAERVSSGYSVNEEGSRLTGISNIVIDQDLLREALHSYGLNLPLDFQADHRHYWTCVSPMGGSSLGIGTEVLNNIWGITWDGTPEYETPELFTIIDIEENFEHGIWTRINVQPDEHKVDKTDEPNRIYGTDEEGRQITYDADALGLVDDVLVDGESVVVDEIAYITLADRVRHLEVLGTTPGSASDNEIVQYIGETTENYTNGYFYKASEGPVESTITPHVVIAGVQDSDVVIDKDIFETYVQPESDLELHFIYQTSENSWTLEGESVDLTNYGISFDVEITPQNDDDLYIDYRAATTSFSWTRINVQPQVDISDKQDKDHTEVYKVGFNGGWEDANSIVDAGSHIAKTNNADGTVTIDVDDITDAGTDVNASDTGLTTGKAVYEYGETKVDKTNATSKIYGTDNQGEQTTYDLDSFGLVDDVLVDGDSVVDNDKIARIDLTGKVDKTDTASQIYGTDDQGEQITYNVSDFQETLVNQVNIKSVNGESLLGSGNLELGQYLVFPNSWPTSSSVTTKQFCDVVAEDSTAVEGKMYLGEVRFSDLSTVGLVNAEIVVKIMKGTTTASKVIVLDMTSGNHAPYRWQYTYWNHGSDVSGWIGFVPTTDIASKVYGTDAQGNQTTYSLDDFGAIDDVRVDGQSVVENQIANITLSDRIRKLAVLPTTPGSTSNGEIVEYVGATTEDYTNGYFYKAASQPVASTLTPHIISSVIHDSDITTNISTFESYVHPLDDMELHFTYVGGESSWYLDDEVVNLANYGIVIDSLLTPNDSDELYIDYRTNTIRYNWTRVNVQPTTTVVDNLTTQSSTDALSANMGYELNERIDAVEGRGRFLSVWDCSTGLPQTNPPVSPYEYHSGDYFIVGVASPAHPSEITQIVQTVGSTLSNLAVQDITDFESQLSELVDTTLIFVFDNNNNWTLEGNVVDITDYSITYTGTPVEGDRIRVVYSAEVINYRPSGLQYVNGVASTVIETGDVVVNDTYIFDGTTWVLQASGQREVTFDSLAGSPYDNTNLAIALNAKVDDVQVDGTSVVTNGVASIDLTGKVDTTDSASKVYGTNAQGGQTLYDLDDFGQVDDVQLNGTSVVDANKIANIEPEASDIAYTHPDHPSLQTVEDALDHLLYIEPTVTLHLDQTLSAYEIGSSINSVGLIWSWNKTITSQSLNQGIGDLSTSTTSYTYTPANPIDSNITFTITGGDGVETATSSVSVSFMPKRYWGVSALTSLTDADILNLSQELSTSRTQTRTFDCSGGKYFYFVIKTSYCNNIGFKVNGMTFSDMDVETRNFTNASGHIDQYNIYRVHNIQTGDNIPVEVL